MGWDIAFAALVGIAVTAVYAMRFRSTASIAQTLAFFLAVFLTAWAGGIWVTPPGPTVGTVRLFPFIMVGTILALLLAAVAPHRHFVADRGKAVEERTTEKNANRTLNVFFWLLLILLIGTIIAGYLSPRTGY
jgi:lysylphosphatidylglycerol synthetase-like protein (DUF2156 family)